MTVPQHTLNVVRGDDYAGPVVRWLTGDRQPIAITSARLHIRRQMGTADLSLLGLIVGAGLTIGGAGSNEVTVAMTDDQTAVLTDGVYDLEVVAADGRVRTLVGGRVSVTKDVTR